MLIALLRHGEAEPWHALASGSDSARQLTEHGRESVADAANTLAAVCQGSPGPHAWRLYHSPFTRTTQTAKIFSQALASDQGKAAPIEACAALLGDNKPSMVCDWLDQLMAQGVSQAVLVTHQPLVSQLCAWLVDGGSTAAHAYPFYPASMALLRADIIGQGCAQLLSLDHHH